MAIPTTFEEAVAEAPVTVGRLKQIVEGPVGEAVETPGGPVDTIRETQRKMQATVDAIAPDVMAAKAATEGARDQAVDAAQVAITQGNSFPTIALGIAGTTTGQRFTVWPGGLDQLKRGSVFKNDAGVAVLLWQVADERDIDERAGVIRSGFGPYMELTADQSGRVHEYLRRTPAGLERQALTRYTYDSLQGQDILDVLGVSEVVRLANGRVVSLRWASGATFLVDEQVADGDDQPAQQTTPVASYDHLGVPQSQAVQQNYPSAVQLGNRYLLSGVGYGDPLGGTGNKLGELLISEQKRSGIFVQNQIGRELAVTAGALSDDHDNGAILVDKRVGAKYPLIVFQSDHAQGGAVRMWRSTTGRVEDLQLFGAVTPAISTAYVKAVRNPLSANEILLFTRHGSNGPGRWHCYRSTLNTDEPGVWPSVPFIQDDNLYWYPAEAQDSLHIVAIASNETNNDLRYFTLKWSDYSLRSPGQVDAIVANIFAATDYAHPMTDSRFFLAYTPPAGVGNFGLQAPHPVSATEVLFVNAEGNPGDMGGTSAVKYGVLNPTTAQIAWEKIASAGYTYNHGPNAKRTGGSALLAPGVVAISQIDVPGQSYSELKVFKRGSDGVWASTQTVEARDDIIMLPNVMRRYDTASAMVLGDKLVYQTGRYTSFTNNNLTQRLAPLKDYLS